MLAVNKIEEKCDFVQYTKQKLTNYIYKFGI